MIRVKDIIEEGIVTEDLLGNMLFDMDTKVGNMIFTALDRSKIKNSEFSAYTNLNKGYLSKVNGLLKSNNSKNYEFNTLIRIAVGLQLSWRSLMLLLKKSGYHSFQLDCQRRRILGLFLLCPEISIDDFEDLLAKMYNIKL